MERVALIAGVSGTTGGSIAEYLVKRSWTKIYGISRRTPIFLPQKVDYIQCDLLDDDDARAKLSRLHDVTHVFIAALAGLQHQEELNIIAQRKLTINLLESLSNAPVKHIALVTGSKYYFSSFEVWGEHAVVLPFKEDARRPPLPSFYHEQEDIVMEYATRMKYTWHVARPSLVSAFCPTSLITTTTIIAVYAAICKHTEKPFVFPGPRKGIDTLFDATEGELLGKHLEWQINTPEAHNEAFNVVNGDLNTWRSFWPQLAAYFGFNVESFAEEAIGFDTYLAENSQIWNDIVQKYGLRPFKLADLVKPGFANMIFAMPTPLVCDMNKSRDMGFLDLVNTSKSFYRVFDRLQQEKVIPMFK